MEDVCDTKKKLLSLKADTHRHGSNREVNNRKENIENFCHNSLKLQNGFM